MYQIFVHKNGDQLGPFDEHAIQRAISDGDLSPDDPAWTAESGKWQPLAQLVPTRSQIQQNHANGASHPQQPVTSSPITDRATTLNVKTGCLGMLAVVVTAVLLFTGLGVMLKIEDSSVVGLLMILTGIIGVLAFCFFALWADSLVARYLRPRE